MTAPASRVASTSVWLATSYHAYLAYLASTRSASVIARWAAALTAASVAYVLVMLALASVWQRDSAHAAIFCAGGMMVATLCDTWVASVILPPSHRRAGAWVCTLLGVAYPLALAAHSPAGTPIHAMQLLYVVATAIGGVAALRMQPPTVGASFRSAAHV